MSTQIVYNDQQWPKLTPPGTGSARENDNHNNDWEILDDTKTQQHRSQQGVTDSVAPPVATDFVVIDDNEIDDDHQPTSSSDRKILRHSVSSPLFADHTSDASKRVPPTDSPGLEQNEVVGEHDDDDGFSIISDVASVWTSSSTAKSAMTVSFRDAILLSSTNTGCYRSVTLSSIEATTNPLQQQSPRRQRSRVQPIIVVVDSPPRTKHIRRCSKSTGDLLSLNVSEEFNGASLTTSHTSCTDRMYDDEVYYRKAIGAVSRINGMKLRPDEAKRRDMILFKKNQQRQLSSSSNNGIPKLKNMTRMTATTSNSKSYR
jgi:hypothetical protein